MTDGAKTTNAKCLRDGFLNSARRFPDREALAIGKENATYRELKKRAETFARALDEADAAFEGPPAAQLTAVFGHRHVTAFAGILASLFRGHGYVPLNPAFPVDRSAAMLIRSRARSVVVGPSGAAKLDALLDALNSETKAEPQQQAPSFCFLLPEADPDTLAQLKRDHERHQFIIPPEQSSGDYRLDGALTTPSARKASPEDLAYLLFTSGSTGTPKGVMVAQRNVTTFVDSMVERYGFTEEDRFSQTFDLTFDLSAFDMFCAWEVGACLCVPTASEKLFPGKYVSKQALTVWFSVPSTGVIMNKLRMLKDDAYPSLRYVLFCGEALPIDIVKRFAAAAPNAVAENLYGPTELTIACTLYRWTDTSETDSLHGVVPIGLPYPKMRVLIAADEKGTPAEPDDLGVLEGELLLAGPQVTLGYWEDPERTSKAFITPPGETETFYRTGDRVRWKAGDFGNAAEAASCWFDDAEAAKNASPILYLGRVDHQIKIKGYRVELGEIEAVAREVAKVDLAIAVGYPETPSGADGVVVFISETEQGGELSELDDKLMAVKTRLPPYMQPSKLIEVATFPLNANGKVDRRALLTSLDQGA